MPGGGTTLIFHWVNQDKGKGYKDNQDHPNLNFLENSLKMEKGPPLRHFLHEISKPRMFTL